MLNKYGKVIVLIVVVLVIAIGETLAKQDIRVYVQRIVLSKSGLSLPTSVVASDNY